MRINSMVEHEITGRVPRYPIVVDAEVPDTYNKVQTKARTTTLGLYGCGIATSNPLSQGTSVRIRLSHRGTEVKALGIVAYVRPNLDMGIAFTDIGRESERILEMWITDLKLTSAQ
jgi:hypothetical protein